MLAKEDLVSIAGLPAMTDISLQLLQEFYEDYFCANTYVYEFSEGPKIKLSFYKENLCHLLGLQHIVPKNQINAYKAHAGYQGIKDGKITFEHLKGINKPCFKAMKDRFRYFPYIYQLLQAPQAIKFDSTKVAGSRIRCTIMLYDAYNNANIHLGLEGKNGHFIAKTFLVEKNEGDKFIKGQTSLNIKSVSIVPKVPETVEQSAVATDIKA